MGESKLMGRTQPLPVVVPVPPVAMPIMKLPQSVVVMLPLTVSVNIRSVALCVTSIETMSSVPPALAMPGSISPVESVYVSARADTAKRTANPATHAFI